MDNAGQKSRSTLEENKAGPSIIPVDASGGAEKMGDFWLAAGLIGQLYFGPQWGTKPAATFTLSIPTCPTLFAYFESILWPFFETLMALKQKVTIIDGQLA